MCIATGTFLFSHVMTATGCHGNSDSHLDYGYYQDLDRGYYLPLQVSHADKTRGKHHLYGILEIVPKYFPPY